MVQLTQTFYPMSASAPVIIVAQAVLSGKLQQACQELQKQVSQEECRSSVYVTAPRRRIPFSQNMATLQAVLSGSMQQACQELQKQVSQEDGVQKAADLIHQHASLHAAAPCLDRLQLPKGTASQIPADADDPSQVTKSMRQISAAIKSVLSNKC